MAEDLPAPPPTPAAVAKLRADVAQLLNDQQVDYWKTVIQLLKLIAFTLENPVEETQRLPKEFQDRRQRILDGHWKVVDLLENRQREVEDALREIDPAIKWG